jgi:hypothetical protein
VPLHPQLQAVIQVPVVQAAQREVVRPLLAVAAQRKQAAVGLAGEKLERRLAAGLKRAHVGVAAAEGLGVRLLLAWARGVVSWPNHGTRRVM